MPAEVATKEQASIVNGVNVTALMETIDAVKRAPETAAFRFRGSNTWLGGDHNRSTFKQFYGAGAEHRTSASGFVLDNGEPEVLLGADEGANPAEHLLNALMGCLTTTMTYHAAARGIEIKGIETEAEGDLDLRGFLGLSDTIRKGYQNPGADAGEIQRGRGEASGAGAVLADLRRRLEVGSGGPRRRNLLIRNRAGRGSGGSRRRELPALPPGRRRQAEQPLEGAVEGCLGLVADLVGNAHGWLVACAEALGGNLQPPAGEVVHRRLADQPGEALGQGRTRQADLAGKVVHGPWFAEPAVDQHQRPGDEGVL